MASAINLNTKAAAETKLNFLLAAVQGDGDLTALLAYADWLEDNGSDRRAAEVRKRAYRYARDKGRTVTGETWLRWHAAYELGLIAEGLVSKTLFYELGVITNSLAIEPAFRRFRYLGNYNEDGSMARNDGSMEYQLAQGWVPSLRRSSKRQMKLAKIIEGLGYKVIWRAPARKDLRI
jgi:uncharacterized protein (TIGR02996 family)